MQNFNLFTTEGKKTGIFISEAVIKARQARVTPAVHQNLLKPLFTGNVLFQLPEDSEHSDVGFSGSRRGANQKILVGLVSRFEDDGLNSIQALHALKKGIENFILGHARMKNNQQDNRPVALTRLT